MDDKDERKASKWIPSEMVAWLRHSSLSLSNFCHLSFDSYHNQRELETSKAACGPGSSAASPCKLGFSFAWLGRRLGANYLLFLRKRASARNSGCRRATKVSSLMRFVSCSSAQRSTRNQFSALIQTEAKWRMKQMATYLIWGEEGRGYHNIWAACRL